MALQTATSNLGFLTILREGTGYLGGYLVTNGWGRPLEFRLSSAVQPNRVQQILYGPSLEPYLCGELLGKTLVEKSSASVQVILTDHAAALNLRLHLETPVALVNLDDPANPLTPHGHFPSDGPVLRGLHERLGQFDFGEPFQRIREAIAPYTRFVRVEREKLERIEADLQSARVEVTVLRQGVQAIGTATASTPAT